MDYRTGILVGRGGMGEVYRAWDPVLERPVALKYLRVSDPDQVARLQQEARAQARIDHPAVCRVYEVGDEEGRPFIAMQFVDGRQLDEAAADMSLEQKVVVVREVAEAVQAAHAAGLIHRDLKPANILVATDGDGRPRPYVLDFGIAREQEVAGLTATGQVIGTPGYLSPEQARGETTTLDRRTDVFSLGVILYELLTGRRPFRGESQVEVLMALLTREPEPPRRLAPWVPRDLETVILRCLEKEPDRRYPSARELADDLGRWLLGEPVLSRRTGPVDRMVRRVRRHPAVAAMAALLVVLATAGAAKYTVDLGQQRRLAESARADAESLVGFMLRDLFNGLEPLGRLDLLDAVAEEADGYYRRFKATDLAPEQRVQRAIVLRNLAGVRDAQGHLELALDDHRRAAELLENAVAGGDAPTGWLAELATARSEVAESLQELGDLDGCLRELERGLAIARRLTAVEPTTLDGQQVLVELLINRAWARRERGDTEAALADLDDARSAIMAVSAAAPADLEWRFRRAEVESYAARVQQEADAFDASAAALSEARRLLVGLADDDPSNTRWQFELVLTDGRLGALAGDRGDPAAATAAYGRALERGLRLVRHDPANARWEREVSVLHSSLGALLLVAGEPAAARDSFAAGLDISERLAARSPASATATNDLAWDWLQLGGAEAALGDGDAARRAWERSVVLMAPVVTRVREPWYLDTWAMALLRLGRVDEARPAVEELLAAGWSEPDFLELATRHGLAPSP